MLSKLISAEKRTRTNGDEFYVCTFSYSQGAKDAPTFITIGGVKVLNPQAAAIRNINLVKCLFPTEDETAKAYKKNLDRFIKCVESDSKTFTTKKGEVVKLSDCEFSLPLVYKTLPVSEVLGVSKIYYADANGEQKKADRIEYVFRNKTYIATPELSKGCCVGCAFVNNMNCANFKDRMDICHKGYIFKRKFNHIDE